MHRDSSGSSWSHRHARALLAVAWLLLAAITAVALIDAHERSRGELEERMQLRTGITTRFVDSYVSDFFAQERRIASRQLSGEIVSKRDFDEVVDLFGTEAAVLLDARGDLLRVAPTNPSLIGGNLSGEYAHLEQATAGSAAVSNVVPSAVEGKPIVAFAVPFRSAAGRRVFSGAFDVTSTPFATYLNQAAVVAPNRISLIDAEGATIAASDPDAPTPELPSDEVQGDTGGLAELHSSDGEYVLTQPVAGTPWRVVFAAPEANLYEPIEGVQRLLPWLLWLGFAAGGLLCVVLVGRLIDRRAELGRRGAELEQANEELDRFASIASHDLSNPLRTISGFAQLLQRNPSASLDERGRDHLERIVGGAARMQSLIDDLLRFARSGKGEILSEPVELGVVVAEVLADLEGDVEERLARVEVGPLPRVAGDRGQLRQLLQNLIANALKFSGEESPLVEVSATGAPGGWALAVADNGEGVSSEERERIFDPFCRLGQTSDRPGTGLGLAICARIVERHGGTIRCEANEPRGTRFVFTLPASDTRGEAPGAGRSGEAEPRVLASRR